MGLYATGGDCQYKFPKEGKVEFCLKQKSRFSATLLGAPTEIRTPALSLKGMRPGPLDDGGSFLERANSIIPFCHRQANFKTNFRALHADLIVPLHPRAFG